MASASSSPLPSPHRQRFTDQSIDEDDTLHITKPPKTRRDDQGSATQSPSRRSSTQGSPRGSVSRSGSLLAERKSSSTSLPSTNKQTSSAAATTLQPHPSALPLLRQGSGGSSSDQSHYSTDVAAQALADERPDASSDAQEVLAAEPEHPDELGSAPLDEPSLASPTSTTAPSISRHSSRLSDSRQSPSTSSFEPGPGHSREPSTVLPSPPLDERGQPDGADEPAIQTSEEYNNIMNEIESAIEKANLSQPSSPPAAASRVGAQGGGHHQGLAVSTPGFSEQTGYFSSKEPQAALSSSSPSLSVHPPIESPSAAADNPPFRQPNLEELQNPGEDHASQLPSHLPASPSIYSIQSQSRSPERRTSSYTPREPNKYTATSHSPHVRSGAAETKARLAAIRRRQAPESCLLWHDVAKRKTPGERALAYAHRINALSQTESGLALWVALKRQGDPLMSSTISTERSFGHSSAMQGRRRDSWQHQQQQQQRPTRYLRQEPSTDFVMRPDSSKATDLTSYAHQAVPTSFSNATVPYPGVYQTSSTPAPPPPSPSTSAAHRLSTGGFSVPKSGTVSGGGRSTPMMGAKAAFLSLGRRTSARATAAMSPSQRPLSTSPSNQPMQSLSRPSMQISGPRSSPSNLESFGLPSRPSSSSTTHISITREDVEKLSDVLPQASTHQLETYLRKTSGDATLALQCFLEDERTGSLLC